ncbi:HNH endonuclease [Azospirillum sp. TSA2s]|nr:HNH endonuclease [Azospirillum sp. TSA2s]
MNRKADKRLTSLRPTLATLDTRAAKPMPKTADPFYLSPEWKTLVARLIQQRGRRCEMCGKTHEDDGTPTRLIGDHVVERRDGGADLDPANIQLLCSREGGNGRAHEDGKVGGCHARKTARARNERMARRA